MHLAGPAGDIAGHAAGSLTRFNNPNYDTGAAGDSPTLLGSLHMGHPDGSPSEGRLITTDPNFWAKVDKQAIGCWLWTGFLNRSGYGQYGRQLAHRIVYEVVVGPIPVGLELDHLCRVKHCVNPEHLDPVIHKVNVLRGVGLTATNSRKTECPQGHAYDETNTIFLKGGGRRCRRCQNGRRDALYWRQYRLQRKAQGTPLP